MNRHVGYLAAYRPKKAKTMILTLNTLPATIMRWVCVITTNDSLNALL